MVSPSRWAVIGASGFIGRALVRELREYGASVIELHSPRLTLSPGAGVDEAYERLGYYSGQVGSLAASLAGVDVVVNAAGIASPDSRATAPLFGANALLPLVIAVAAEQAGVSRVLHLSSAAVQGRRTVLDESPACDPFSPYSHSKALAEDLLLRRARTAEHGASTQVVVVRATSVQGPGRRTTSQLRRLARSPLASTAGPGDLPTVVSSVQGLVEFVRCVGFHPGPVPPIVLQPWEGVTTRSVLEAAGDRIPRQLPVLACRLLVAAGYCLGVLVPRISGLTRRVELMWMGQSQDARWSRSVGITPGSYVIDVLRDGVTHR